VHHTAKAGIPFRFTSRSSKSFLARACILTFRLSYRKNYEDKYFQRFMATKKTRKNLTEGCRWPEGGGEDGGDGDRGGGDYIALRANFFRARETGPSQN
jgi:hypothetical protein